MYIVKFVIWILTAICWMKVFSIANIKGWKAFIPFYCDYTRFGLAEKKWLYFPFLAFSIIEFIANLIYTALIGLNLVDSILDVVSLDLDIQLWFWGRTISMLFVLGIEVIVGILTARNFGKAPLFGIGIAILPIVFAPILAFDNSTYKGTK